MSEKPVFLSMPEHENAAEYTRRDSKESRISKEKIKKPSSEFSNSFQSQQEQFLLLLFRELTLEGQIQAVSYLRRLNERQAKLDSNSGLSSDDK